MSDIYSKTNEMESTIQVVVDRIEDNNIAVIELPDLDQFEINKKYLPKKVKEGNVIDITFKLNPDAEKKKREEIIKLQEELLNRSKNL
ncbi:MAG TPA: DUF3006 domain-containing protein [bacterium]|mgnify:CR=1 FL=1|nr:DUF3006 domain-containing protein [bacterium]HOL46588.1 DUF3006 domain-containing protein [bacterium]HPQ17841.1 DUF3006 domain-containing protein [bacterium]